MELGFIELDLFYRDEPVQWNWACSRSWANSGLQGRGAWRGAWQDLLKCGGSWPTQSFPVRIHHKRFMQSKSFHWVQGLAAISILNEYYPMSITHWILFKEDFKSSGSGFSATSFWISKFLQVSELNPWSKWHKLQVMNCDSPNLYETLFAMTKSDKKMIESD